MQRALFILAALLVASCGSPSGLVGPPILRGDWSSSGGENVRDANNPWWVRNTREVTYCIAVEEATVSASPARIRQAVEDAFSFWRAEFTTGTPYFRDPFHMLEPERFNRLGIATQKFSPVDCTGREDLRLQFGYGTLDENQKHFLKDPTHFIGIAVRTRYDERQLKGQGFIFIGSDRGPNRAAPGTSIEGVWKYEAPLRLAIVHELGHVFGVPHLGNRYSLMSAESLEQFTSRAIEPLLRNDALDYRDALFFFHPPLKVKRCVDSDDTRRVWRSFFALQKGEDCLELAWNASRQAIDVRSGSRDLGSIDSLELEVTSWPTSGVVLVLSPRQSVFGHDDLPGDNATMIPGPAFVSGAGGGMLRLPEGERAIHLQLGPDEFALSGFYEGRIRRIFSWRR